MAAEHDLRDYIGIAVDGMGYGEDGTIWGGEIFDVKNEKNFKRIGSLEEQIMVGGDSAAIYPRKMLYGILQKFLSDSEILKLKMYDDTEIKLYSKMILDGFNVHKTTSTGRILDAASALLDICNKRYYDGRPAMMLEAYATKPLEIEHVIEKSGGRKILSTTRLFEFLVENLDRPKEKLAATVQMYLCRGLMDMASGKNKEVVYSGGVAYNKMMSGYLIEQGVITNKKIPPGDGGICFGQAYLAGLNG